MLTSSWSCRDPTHPSALSGAQISAPRSERGPVRGGNLRTAWCSLRWGEKQSNYLISGNKPCLQLEINERLKPSWLFGCDQTWHQFNNCILYLGRGRQTYLDAGRELELKGLSFSFFFCLCCVMLLGDNVGSTGLQCQEDGDSVWSCTGYLENSERNACQVPLPLFFPALFWRWVGGVGQKPAQPTEAIAVLPMGLIKAGLLFLCFFFLWNTN